MITWKFFPRQVRKMIRFCKAARMRRSLPSVRGINGANANSLFITHDMGGGTSQYVRDFMARHKGEGILMVTSISYARDFFYKVLEVDTGKCFAADDFEEIFKRVADLKKIYVNSLITFYRYKEIIMKIMEVKKNKSEIRLEYFVHDFHCICPQCNLMKGKSFCALDCEKMKCSFDPHAVGSYGSVEQWRKMWGTFLARCDETRTFSKSSKEIVLKAYPNLDAEKISVRPHPMDYFTAKAIDFTGDEDAIAIMGSIPNEAKGLSVARKILSFAKKRNLKMCMIGDFPKAKRVHAKNIVYADSYEVQKLRDILIRHKVKATLFLSVCPETFSFLVSELMILEMPIVGFGIGAQGEKIGAYEKGICLKPDAACEEIFAAAERISRSAF